MGNGPSPRSLRRRDRTRSPRSRKPVIRLSHELAAQAKRRDHRRIKLRKGRRVLQLTATMTIGGAVLLGGLAAAGALPLN